MIVENDISTDTVGNDGCLPEEMRNNLICGDVLDALKSLPGGCVDMVYGDPDYGVGINYSGRKFTQKWDEYIEWYIELAKESLRVLRDNGNLFFINYPKQNAYLRVNYLDEAAHDVFDYVWVYPTSVGHSARRFTNAHRSILHVTKSKENNFYKGKVALPYKNPRDRRIQQAILSGSPGRMPYSWLEFNLVKNVSAEKTSHPCQIPIPLYDTLLKASTKQDDDVFILFGGSGNEIAHTMECSRNFVSCEIVEDYYNMIMNRLLGNIHTQHGVIK